MPTFDISAKIVTTEQKSWVIHGGRAQQNIQDFIGRNAVFLEAPYLILEEGVTSSRTLLRSALRRAEAFYVHHNTTGSSTPSDRIEDYDSSPFEDSGKKSLAGGIGRLFGRVSKGDIVMSPGRIEGPEYSSPAIHFGEIASEFNTEDYINGSRAISQQVPIRRVNWLNTVPRKEISVYLDKKIGKPPALREIAIERDTEEILQHTYKSYIFENTSSSLIEADRYDGSDFITLTRSQHMIAALVAAHHAFSNQQHVAEITDFEAFVRTNFANAAVENIVVDFASPGFWRIIGASASMAAFVGLGIAVLASDVDLAQIGADLIVTNSISAPGQAESDVQANMKAFFSSIDNLEVSRLREIAKSAHEEIGLKSSVNQVGP